MTDHARFCELLAYDPDTGVLRWRQDRTSGRGKVNVHAGDEAGFIARVGYRIIRVDGKNYRAHRVIWLMTDGEWPALEIDHINGDRADNRLSNLREVTRHQNAKNRKTSARNKSGHKGVSWVSKNNTWRADICSDGKTNFLGAFTSKEEAAAAYESASRRLHNDFRRAA